MLNVLLVAVTVAGIISGLAVLVGTLFDRLDLPQPAEDLDAFMDAEYAAYIAERDLRT